MNRPKEIKWMTLGEGSLAAFFAVSAFVCLLAAAKAEDAAFAFHANVSMAASLIATFAILNRYFDRPASLPPQEIGGRPNYNLAPTPALQPAE